MNETRSTWLWVQPFALVLIYPLLIFSFASAVGRFHRLGNPLLAACALLLMLLAFAIPALAARALILTRHEAGPALPRAILYLMFATSPLFTLTFSLVRLLRLEAYHGALALGWISAWAVIGSMLYFSPQGRVARPQKPSPAWLRVTHGVTALCLLCGFVLAHLLNHDLAAWSVHLHATVMKLLRVWYRSAAVEPVLLGALVVMIGTGVPMVLHYSRLQMDALRVTQAATGVFVGLYVCSHVLATLIARRHGVETDWFFAAGATSLLDGSILDRLIPYYILGVFFFVLHVACGIRVVLLHHGVTTAVGNRVFFSLALAGLVVTTLSGAALLGLHLETV